MKITSKELTDIFQKHVENLFPNKELKPVEITAVSYTHLDVYKRQALESEKRVLESEYEYAKKLNKNAKLALETDCLLYTSFLIMRTNIEAIGKRALFLEIK